VSVLTDKLIFVIQRRAVSYIQSKTALSTYAVRQFRLGSIPKVSLDRYSINAMYRTEAYRYARQTGFSTMNATRIRDWSVSRMLGEAQRLTEIIDSYASNIISQKMQRDRLKGIYKDYDVYYQENIEWIKDAYRKSKKTMEEIEENKYDSP